MKRSCRLSGTVACAVFLFVLFRAPTFAAPVTTYSTDDLLFIHHSSGGHWLLNSLREALREKAYVDEYNDIGYTTDIAPDDGRPDSLTFDSLVPGDHTDVCHWVRWFNDYLNSVKTHGCDSGVNRVIMFKSCYPNSNVGAEAEPGDPFSTDRNLSNYKAVFRHPSGTGNTYTYNGYSYKPLEDIFAENPDTLFIYVTAPPLLVTSTNADNAARARQFNTWVKTTWLDSYHAKHPGLHNVAVFDWFDVLAVPEGDTNANTIRADYATNASDNHPNDTANSYSTKVFATNQNSFLDTAYQAFISSSSSTTDGGGDTDSSGNSSGVVVYPTPYYPDSSGPYGNPSSGKGIVFSGLTGQARIRIFTIAGDLVREITVADGTTQYLWDATNSGGAAVASGIYLYLVDSPALSKITKGKLAIIR